MTYITRYSGNLRYNMVEKQSQNISNYQKDCALLDLSALIIKEILNIASYFEELDILQQTLLFQQPAHYGSTNICKHNQLYLLLQRVSEFQCLYMLCMLFSSHYTITTAQHCSQKSHKSKKHVVLYSYKRLNSSPFFVPSLFDITFLICQSLKNISLLHTNSSPYPETPKSMLLKLDSWPSLSIFFSLNHPFFINMLVT